MNYLKRRSLLLKRRKNKVVFTATQSKNLSSYCFVANIASMLLDEENKKLLTVLNYKREKDNKYYHNLQDLIIEKFKDELNHPDRPIGRTSCDFTKTQDIFIDVGLTNKRADWNYVEKSDEAKEYLLKNKKIAHRILIYVRAGDHCVRLLEVKNEGVLIMEPGEGEIKNLSWEEFKCDYYALTVVFY